MCCWNVSCRPRMSLWNEYKRDISASAYPEYHIQYQPSYPLRGLPFLAHVNNSRQYFNCAPVIRGLSRLFYHSSTLPPPLFLFSKLSYEREYGGSCRYCSSALYSWLVRSIGCTGWWWWWWSLNDRRGTWFMRSTGTVLSFY